MTNKRAFAPPTSHAENLFSFSNLQSHHYEGFKPNSNQSFFLHPLGTMEIVEFFDIKFIKYIDLSHVQVETIAFESILHQNTAFHLTLVI
jgi:hypothetical protein